MRCEFVREYFEDHENERIAASVALYERERITLGDAARLADVDRWTMRDILREHGVELGSASLTKTTQPTRLRQRANSGFGGEDSDDEESRAK